MRWKSDVKYAERTPARIWSKKDEGNFGGRSLLTPEEKLNSSGVPESKWGITTEIAHIAPEMLWEAGADEDTLAHYGVPGMKWGVKTKEYVKKGYDTLKRRQAILKMKRKAEAKAQYDEGYRRGQRVMANTHLIKSRSEAVLKRKRAQENTWSLTDRAVNKAADYALKKSGIDEIAKAYGLEHLMDKGKDFLKGYKDQQIDRMLDWIQTEEGQKKIQKVTAFLGRGASATIGAGARVASYARSGGRAAKKTIRSGARTAARAGASAVKSGYKWLRTGEPTGAQRIRSSMQSARQTMSRYNNIATNALNRGTQYAHLGMKSAHNQLNQLLSKRPRRRA